MTLLKRPSTVYRSVKNLAPGSGAFLPREEGKIRAARSITLAQPLRCTVSFGLGQLLFS